MFPTKEELEQKKLEKLKPLVDSLVQECVDALYENGAPVRVPCGKYPAAVRQQVVVEAKGANWSVTTDYDAKSGGDVFVINEMVIKEPFLGINWFNLK